MSSELNYAYSILSDPLKRQQYDSTLKKPLRLSLKRQHKYMIFVISVGVLIIIFMQTNLPKNNVSSSDSENSNILIDGNTFASKVDTSLLDFALKSDPLKAQPRENELSELMPSFSYDELKYMVWISETGLCYHLDPTCYGLSNDSVLISLDEAQKSGYLRCALCFKK